MRTTVLAWVLVFGFPAFASLPEVETTDLNGAIREAQALSPEDQQFLKKKLGLSAKEYAEFAKLRQKVVEELMGSPDGTWGKFTELENKTARFLGKQRYARLADYRRQRAEAQVALEPRLIMGSGPWKALSCHERALKPWVPSWANRLSTCSRNTITPFK